MPICLPEVDPAGCPPICLPEVDPAGCPPICLPEVDPAGCPPWPDARPSAHQSSPPFFASRAINLRPPNTPLPPQRSRTSAATTARNPREEHAPSPIHPRRIGGSTPAGMSSWEDDAPLPDESPPSYDGYQMSSSEEEGDAQMDDTVFYEDVFGEVSSEGSFATDIFPDELTVPPGVRLMGGTVEALNRKLIGLCEDSRTLVNQIYRTDKYLKSDPYFESIWSFKNDCHKRLLKLREGESGLESVMSRITKLGCPYYRPPSTLWNYMYFFWFDPASDNAVSYCVTPRPHHNAPHFHSVCAKKADTVVIMDTLKNEEFSIGPGLDQGEYNMGLVADFNSLSLKTQDYWKIQVSGLLTSDETAGLYAELLVMEEVTNNKISTAKSEGQKSCSFPCLLKSALNELKKKKKEEEKKEEKK